MILFVCINIVTMVIPYGDTYCGTVFILAGEFVGFTDLGDINTHIASFEAQLESGTSPTKPLAKSVLVFMVRGLNSGLQFPYAQFPCASLRGDQIFYLVWKVIGRLQQFGFHFLALTGDGLAANRQMFRLHAPKIPSEIIYKASNPFSGLFPSLFFFSDPLKTVRNCFSARTRHLWVSFGVFVFYF